MHQLMIKMLLSICFVKEVAIKKFTIPILTIVQITTHKGAKGMKKYKEPQSPEEALKRLKTAISFICRGRVNDYKPEAAKMLAYLESGLISL